MVDTEEDGVVEKLFDVPLEWDVVMDTEEDGVVALEWVLAVVEADEVGLVQVLEVSVVTVMLVAEVVVREP